MQTESDWAYDGPLSTYTEWDSLLYGIVVGLALSIDRVREDIAREPSKLVAGALLAYAYTRLR